MRALAFSVARQAPSPQLLRRNVKRFRGGLAFEAGRLLYHSPLVLRVIQQKKKMDARVGIQRRAPGAIILDTIFN